MSTTETGRTYDKESESKPKALIDFVEKRLAKIETELWDGTYDSRLFEQEAKISDLMDRVKKIEELLEGKVLDD